MDFIGTQRAKSQEFVAEGRKLSQCDQYVGEEKRVHKRNRRYDEPESAPEVSQTPANKFRTDTFLVIIDRIDAELRKRLGAYTRIAAKFGFLRKLKDLSVEEVVESAKILQEAYPTDLEASLSDFLRTNFVMKSLDVTTASATSNSPAMDDTSSDESDDEDDLTKDDNDVTLNVDSLELRMYRLILENNLETVFPNYVIALRIYLSLMISNCSGERSFSKLKLIKNQLRSCMTQKRLNSLVLLSIENDLLRSIDMSSIINEFALKKSRKQNVYKASTK